MFFTKKEQENSQQEQIKKIHKIKLIDASDNFKFHFNPISDFKPTEEEFIDNQESLFGDDPDLQSQAVNFFSQAISFVSPEIYERILSFKDSSDEDLIDSVVDFLCTAVQSSEISTDLLENTEASTYLLSILEVTQNKDLQQSTINAIRLFSARLEDLMIFFFEQGAFTKCCSIITKCITNDVLSNIQLISICFMYMNTIFSCLDSDHCDELCEIVVPLYQSLIQCSKSSIDSPDQTDNTLRLYIALAELTLNSIHYFIMQCSDQALSSLFDENFVDFIIFLQNVSPKSSHCIFQLLVSISYHDSSFYIPLLPLLGDQIISLAELQQKKDKLKILCLGILRNLAANDEQTILDFLFSEPILEFIQTSFNDDQSYSIIKNASFVYSYLLSSPDDRFKQFLWENGQSAITAMVESLDPNDDEFVESCLICLSNLLSYLEKSDQSAYDECIQLINDTDIEKTLNNVVDSSQSEENIEIANNLREILGVY